MFGVRKALQVQVVLLCGFVLSIFGSQLTRKRYEGLQCTSGTFSSTSNCGYGTTCDGYSNTCVEALGTPHPWLRQPMDQGSCAASQVMAMVSALDDRRSAYGLVEGAKLNTGQQASAQFFLNCMDNAEMLCDGGVPLSRVRTQLLEAVQRNVLPVEDQLPYTGVTQAKKGCWSGKVLGLDKVNMELVYTGSKADLAAHVQTYGPTVVNIRVGPEMFLYSTGVQWPSALSKNTLFAGYHSVVVAGFNEQFFVIKNSWGNHWGEQGYMRVERSHFLNEYMVTEGVSAAKFVTHMISFTSAQAYRRIADRFPELNQVDGGRRDLEKLLHQRRNQIVSTGKYFKNPNEFATSEKFKDRYLSSADTREDLPKLKLAILAALEDLNKQQSKGKYYEVDQVIHADVSVAAGRLFFLVLQLSKYDEKNPDKPLAVEGYATKVWLPFKGYRYTKGTLQAYMDSRKVDTSEYESGYSGYYAYYKIIPVSGDKPNLFPLVSDKAILPVIREPTEMMAYVKYLFQGLYSAAFYGAVGFGVVTSHLTPNAKTALFPMLPGLLIIVFSAIEAGSISGNVVTKIFLGACLGFMDFVMLPWTLPTNALTHTPYLANVCFAMIIILSSWLLVDKHARDEVRELLIRCQVYERPDAEHDDPLASEVMSFVRSYFSGRNADNAPKRKRGRPLERMARNLADRRERQQQREAVEDWDRIGR